jgi:hypothetical protein
VDLASLINGSRWPPQILQGSLLTEEMIPTARSMSTVNCDDDMAARNHVRLPVREVNSRDDAGPYDKVRLLLVQIERLIDETFP